MGIDAHQHFWRPARGDYGWLTPPEHPLICRDFLPPDLAPLLAAAGIERTVVVQAAPSLAETRFLLDLADTTPSIAGVVGWADLAALDAVAAIERLAAHPKLLGLRPMLQDLPQDDWILCPALAPALDAIQAAGLTFDALVTPGHLPHVARFLDRRPDLRVVIDHGAKPDIAGGGLADWSAAMRRLAAETTARCKLSGLATEAAADWTTADLAPYVDVLIDAFGPSRLMWGSDWPVVIEGGGYARWHAAAHALTAALTPAERDAVFGETAAAFYGLAT